MLRTPRVFNPDDYLWTPNGRVFTAERNAAAWEEMYTDLEALFRAAAPETRFFIVMGVQGGGKTTWVRAHCDVLGPHAVFMDAAVPAKRHRARAVALATRFGVRTTAVWIDTPLERALAQNAQRPADEVVPESAVRSVFSLLEAPTVDEGFDEVIMMSEAR
jgi:predicted kinase